MRASALIHLIPHMSRTVFIDDTICAHDITSVVLLKTTRLCPPPFAQRMKPVHRMSTKDPTPLIMVTLNQAQLGFSPTSWLAY